MSWEYHRGQEHLQIGHTCWGRNLFRLRLPFFEGSPGTLSVDDDYYRLVFDGPTADDWVPLTEDANDRFSDEELVRFTKIPGVDLSKLIPEERQRLVDLRWGRMETQINRHTGTSRTEFHLPGRRGRATENAGSVNTWFGPCTAQAPPF